MAWFLLTDAATLITGGSLENGKGGGNERMGSHCRDQMMVQKRSPLIRGRDVNEETLAPHGFARTRCANDPTTVPAEMEAALDFEILRRNSQKRIIGAAVGISACRLSNIKIHTQFGDHHTLQRQKK